MPTLKGFSTEKPEDRERLKQFLPFRPAAPEKAPEPISEPEKSPEPAPAAEGGVIEAIFGTKKRKKGE
jgi:hypothetical protein